MTTTNPTFVAVAHSVLDAEAVGQIAEANFEIGRVRICELWRSFINDVYRLYAGDRYWWLRISPANWRNSPQVVAELEAISIIGSRGASVSASVPDRGGKAVIELEAPEGMRTAVLFSTAEGKELSYFDKDGASHAALYGLAIARLHDACDEVPRHPCHSRIDLDSMVLQPRDVVSKHLSSEDTLTLDRVCSRLIYDIRNMDVNDFSFCHGDLNGSNVHFSSNVPTAFDFDCCGWGSRAFELAAFARGVTWHGVPGDRTELLFHAFLNGYLSHRSIKEADLRLQATMLLAQRLWVTSIHIARAFRLGSSFFGEDYAAAFVRWLKVWEPILDRNDRFPQCENR